MVPACHPLSQMRLSKSPIKPSNSLVTSQHYLVIAQNDYIHNAKSLGEERTKFDSRRASFQI